MPAYEAWLDPADGGAALVPATESAGHRTRGLLDPGATLLYRIDAATWEEACAVHHLRQGWEPYRPQGAARPCPRCGATYYPEGSGECWRCASAGPLGSEGSP